MSFSDWKRQHEAAADPERRRAAQLWNLEAEDRIPIDTDRVRVYLGHLRPLQPAALEALTRLCGRLQRSKVQRPTKVFGRCPVPPGTELPGTLVTFTTGRIVRRYLAAPGMHASTPPRFRGPPKRLPLTGPFKIDTKGTALDRFIWFTFESPGRTLGNSPTEIVRLLGLPHIKAGRLLYRIDYPERPASLFIPTALDANLYEAWAPPPKGHVDPWGMTRDSKSGSPQFPEVVAFVADCRHLVPTARLVSPRVKRQKVGKITPDFMAGRAV